MQLMSCQERGGRKGGLPIREATLVLVRTGLSTVLAGDAKVMLEEPGAVKPKHVSAQAAIHAQSPAVFCVLSVGALWWWWWSQSGIALETDISVAVAT